MTSWSWELSELLGTEELFCRCLLLSSVKHLWYSQSDDLGHKRALQQWNIKIKGVVIGVSCLVDL